MAAPHDSDFRSASGWFPGVATIGQELFGTFGRESPLYMDIGLENGRVQLTMGGKTSPCLKKKGKLEPQQEIVKIFNGNEVDGDIVELTDAASIAVALSDPDIAQPYLIVVTSVASGGSTSTTKRDYACDESFVERTEAETSALFDYVKKMVEDTRESLCPRSKETETLQTDAGVLDAGADDELEESERLTYNELLACTDMVLHKAENFDDAFDFLKKELGENCPLLKSIPSKDGKNNEAHKVRSYTHHRLNPRRLNETRCTN